MRTIRKRNTGLPEPSTSWLPPIADLNSASPADFGAAVALLFEHAPAFAGRLAARRPFDSDRDLLVGAARVAASMPEADQVELVNAHPRLGEPTRLSDASQREQGLADAAVSRELADLQDAYETRFGFRYLVFVAGRPRAALIPDLRRSFAASREAELQRALGDTLAIAADRLERLRRRGG